MKVVLKSSQNDRTHILSLGGSASIGRSSSCEFQVEDLKISGKHCRFILKKDRLEIYDLESKNGTYLNGIRIDQSEVFIGDEVQVGDTIITLEEKRSDAEAIELLTFPGPFKDRLSYELKADFTGARIQNQSSRLKKTATPHSDHASHAREIDVRKKIKSKLKLSIQEIRSTNKFLSMLALMIDSLLFILILLMALIVFKGYFRYFENQTQKLLFLISLEFVVGATFALINFKLMKFTMGETLSGIKKRYQNQ